MSHNKIIAGENPEMTLAMGYQNLLPWWGIRDPEGLQG